MAATCHLHAPLPSCLALFLLLHNPAAFLDDISNMVKNSFANEVYIREEAVSGLTVYPA